MSKRLAAALTLYVLAGVLVAGWSRGARDRSYPVLQTCAALLAIFLLWSKVHSPQYALWILPFFVLVKVHPLWWAAYSLIDSIFYVGIFRWFYDTFQLGLEEMTTAKQAMLAGIWGRAGLLLVLYVVFLLAREATDPPPDLAGDRVLSHPPPTLDAIGASVGS